MTFWVLWAESRQARDYHRYIGDTPEMMQRYRPLAHDAALPPPPQWLARKRWWRRGNHEGHLFFGPEMVSSIESWKPTRAEAGFLEAALQQPEGWSVRGQDLGASLAFVRGCFNSFGETEMSLIQTAGLP